MELIHSKFSEVEKLAKEPKKTFKPHGSTWRERADRRNWEKAMKKYKESEDCGFIQLIEPGGLPKFE